MTVVLEQSQSESWPLVLRAQAGDQDAVADLYRQYGDKVFRFILFRVRNRPIAEDIASDAWLRALKRLDSFTWQGRDVGAWLVTIARNLIADYYKSGRYRFEVTMGDVLDADREGRSSEGSPETVVLDHLTNLDLLAAVKQLNWEQRECIVLRFLCGYSVAETAQAMDRNEGAVKALQYRATRSLARLLDGGIGGHTPLPTSDPVVLARRWCVAHGVPLGGGGAVTPRAMAAYERAMAGES